MIQCKRVSLFSNTFLMDSSKWSSGPYYMILIIFSQYVTAHMIWPSEQFKNLHKERVAEKWKTLALNHYCYLGPLCDWKSPWEFWGLQKLISADQELELISWFRIFYSEVYISEFFLIEFFIMISVVFFLSFLWRHTLTMWLITSLVVVW